MIHNVIHIVDSILLHGPLTEYSAFPFESYNSVVLNAIKGTYRVEQGIASAIPLKQILSFRLRIMTDHSHDYKAIKTLKILKVSILSMCN